MSKGIYTSDQEKLSMLLRQIREKAGLRQADLARRLGRSQSFVSKYESGQHRLDLLELREICKAVDISLEDFVKMFEDVLG
jgi:transcriptional regulator with XRE-family HTH domain